MSEVCQNTHEIKEHKLCKVNNSFMFAIVLLKLSLHQYGSSELGSLL